MKEEVITPRGELVAVQRRAWPWPNLTTEARLKEIGMAEAPAAWLGKAPRGDLALTGLLTLPFLLALALGAVLPFLILLVLLIGCLAFRYLGMPWTIEVWHKGEIVESEGVNGASKSAERVGKIAGLYRSGAVRLPMPPPPPQPQRRSELPIPGQLPGVKTTVYDERPTLSDLSKPLPDHSPQALNAAPTPEASHLPVPRASLPTPLPEIALPSSFSEEEDVQEVLVAGPAQPSQPESHFTVPPDEVSPLEAFIEESVPEAEAPKVQPALPGESPLRKAIRLMEEEEASRRAQAVKPDTQQSAKLRKLKRLGRGKAS